MPTVLIDGLAMVKAVMPGQIGTNKRWTDETVTTLLVAADRAVRERLNVHTHEQVIPLVDDVASYDLDPEFVGISLVEYAQDGATYDHTLKAASYDDLDMAHVKWRTLASGRPDAYYLASAPGVQQDGVKNYSKMLVYPYQSTAGSATLRVSGVGVTPISAHATMTASTDVLKRCHVPYVLAVLYASASPELSSANLSAYKSGCDDIKSRFFQNQTFDRPSRGTR